MDRLLSIIGVIFLFLVIGPKSGFSQHADFSPQTLIVKFKDAGNIEEIRRKSGADPREAVLNMLSGVGAYEIEPLRRQGAVFPRSQLKGGGLDAAVEQAVESLSRIHQVRYSSNISPPVLAAKISRMPGVEYAEPKYVRFLSYVPNDPVSNDFLEYHRFIQGWDISRGSREVVIAIVDAGVGYEHPDLQSKLWINQQEIPPAVFDQADQDSDGEVTPSELLTYLQNNNGDHNGDGEITLSDALHADAPFTTGTDTDGNGYVDDLFGWDFWNSGSFSNPEEDNNPIHDGTDHGTHVAGIAAADTDNGEGIAGAGFDSRYMAVKTGGTTQFPRAIGFGFEGILYAAEQGADIINCSWGGPSSSQAEQEVINFVTSLGSLVVAAAGNDGSEGITYPAAYENVLAVGSVEAGNDRLSSYSNYGFNLDVLATGSSVTSTVFNNAYGNLSGTSMSTPIVSGLAALIKAEHPAWPPQRIGAQIRSSSANLDDINFSGFRNKLGNGKIDAERALSTELPGIVIHESEFVGEGGQKLVMEEDGLIRLTIRNVGAPAGNLTLTLSSLSGQGVILENPDLSTGSMNTGEEREVEFPVRISGNFDLSRDPTVKVAFSDESLGYSDFAVLQYKKLLYDEMNINRVRTSVGSRGAIGFTDAFTASGGVGFVPRNRDGNDFVERNNLLFEGGLMMKINEWLYDAIRGTEDHIVKDFNIRDLFKTRVSDDGQTQTGITRFYVGDDPENPLANITLTTYSYNLSELDNVVFFHYEIENPAEFLPLEGVYVGLFNDWDIGANAGRNSVHYSEQDSIMYFSDDDPQSTQPMAAVAQLGPVSGILAINNAVEGRLDSLTFGLYDGFTEREKLTALRSGIQKTSVSGTDVSGVTASGPYSLAPKSTLSVGFVYAFGDNLDELQSQIAEARNNIPFEISNKGTVLSDTPPPSTMFFQNYPNPFNPSTRLRLDLSESANVSIVVYDILGRKVAELVNRRLEASTHIFNFDGSRLGSGLYFARLKANGRVQTIKMLLVK